MTRGTLDALLVPSAGAQEISRRIREAKPSRVLLTSHLGIDGDSAGSCLALARALTQIGFPTDYSNATAPPEILSHLDWAAHFLPSAEAAQRSYELGIVLDTSAWKRIGEVEGSIRKCRTRLLVDHHEEKPPEGIDHAWIEPTYAGVVLMIAEILDALESKWDATIATALWTGLVTDTASFQQGNTDARSLAWAARFVAEGARPFDVSTHVFETRPASHLRLLGRALSGLVVENGAAWATLTHDDFTAAGANEEDVEGVIRALRAIGGVSLVVLLREIDRPGRSREVKATFRSKGALDVAELARGLGGGGHKMASGAEFRSTIAEAREKIRTALSS